MEFREIRLINEDLNREIVIFTHYQHHLLSKSRGTRNNFDQLHGNSCLSSLVVLEGQLVEDLTSVLGGVLHSLHSVGLLGGGVVEEGDPDVGGEIEVIKSWIRRILIRQGLVVELSILHSLEESLLWHEFHMSLNV